MYICIYVYICVYMYISIYLSIYITQVRGNAMAAWHASMIDFGRRIDFFDFSPVLHFGWALTVPLIPFISLAMPRINGDWVPLVTLQAVGLGSATATTVFTSLFL